MSFQIIVIWQMLGSVPKIYRQFFASGSVNIYWCVVLMPSIVIEFFTLQTDALYFLYERNEKCFAQYRHKYKYKDKWLTFLYERLKLYAYVCIIVISNYLCFSSCLKCVLLWFCSIYNCSINILLSQVLQIRCVFKFQEKNYFHKSRN